MANIPPQTMTLSILCQGCASLTRELGQALRDAKECRRMLVETAHKLEHALLRLFEGSPEFREGMRALHRAKEFLGEDWQDG